MKKENLIFEVVRRNFVGHDDYTFRVLKGKLYITHKVIGDRYVKKAYTPEDILELMNVYTDKTLFSSILEDVSYRTALTSGSFRKEVKKGNTIWVYNK